MTPVKTITTIILILLLILGFSSFYTVTEGQRALLLQLGKLYKNPQTNQVEVMQPGLHFKWPLIEQAKFLDARLQTLTIQASRIITAEKKYVLVDYYVKWRINNFALYFTRAGGNNQLAEILLQQQLNDALRAQFGKRTVQQVISDERSEVMAALLEQTNKTAQALGVSIIDVRIKRIDLPPQVVSAVYNNMRVERERIATNIRSLGTAKAEVIRANADAKVTIAIATANAKAAQIRAEGLAQAARIYADVYTKDPSFYAFYRSLLAYQNIFNNKQDMLVIQPDNQFFKYFNGINLKSSLTTTKTNTKSP